MPKNKNPIIEILLKPEDFREACFVSNGNCPLARAFKRQMKVKKCSVLTYEIVSGKKVFYILGRFGHEDFEEVKAEYALGSKRKWDHYVEIREL